MGQLRARLNGKDPSSIKELRKIVKMFQDYLDAVKNAGDSFPSASFITKKAEALEKSNLVKRLMELRKQLTKDKETCQELHREIMEIELEFKEKRVLRRLSSFAMDLRNWEKDSSRHNRNEAMDSRIEFRECIIDFKERLSKAIDTRCDFDARQVS